MSKILASAASPMPVNSKLMNLIIRHNVFTERYKASLVNKIVGLFNSSIIPDVERKLVKRLGSNTITEIQVKKLDSDLKELNEAYGLMHKNFTGQLTNFAISDAGWITETLKDVVPVGLDLHSPAPAQLKALVKESYVRGKLVKDWFAGLADDTRDKIIQQVNIGMVEGEGVADIVRRIKGTQAANYSDGILNASRRNIEAVVRTSVSGINNGVMKDVYKANEDVVKGVQVVATLDDRTCPICMALDGKVYDIDKAKMPPYHWNCRCVTVPALKSWKELGINLREAPEGTRASMDGQVPASMTYGKWLKKQDEETQDEILGKGKAALFRRGKVPIEKFIDTRNNPLTLEQLQALEKRLKKVS